jgi:spore coat protein CotH
MPFNMGEPLAREIFTRADKNTDKKITLPELQAAADVAFKEADKNTDGVLDETELGGGLASVMPRPNFGPGGAAEAPKPGPRVTPAEVQNYPKAKLYEPTVLRTLFFEFEAKDWEAELSDFYRTDVEVPATLTVDGKKYANVGVHFRGTSSYFTVGAGSKRSFNVSIDHADAKQRLYGYKTLNLLNAHGDDSLLNTVLYSHIARQYMPAPDANIVKVVINGESWGLYTNVQQFDKKFLEQAFKSSKGARWKVKGSPGGGGGLDYIGDRLEDYKRRYEIKSEDNEADWKALVELCRVLTQTPVEELEEKLKPILDMDSLLWFLALDVALINNDGYWVRASDFCIYRDGKGKFHIVPHDMNESFSGAMGMGMGGGGRGGRGGPGGGPGGPGGPTTEPQKGPPPAGGGAGGPGGPGGPGMGPRGGGLELDPLVAMDDQRKPLRSRLLAVPALKKRYLAHLRTIAEESLDWKKLGPVVQQYCQLIENEVELDTKKLSSLEAFRRATADTAATDQPGRGRGPRASLRTFADARRQFLLNHAEIKKAVSQGE